MRSYCGTGCNDIFSALSAATLAAYPGLSAVDYKACYCSAAYDPGRHIAGDFSSSICHSQCQAFREAEFAAVYSPTMPGLTAAEFFTCTCSPNYSADSQLVSLCASECHAVFELSWGTQYVALLPNTTCVDSEHVRQCTCSDPVNVWPQLLAGAFTAVSSLADCNGFNQGLSCTFPPPSTPPSTPPSPSSDGSGPAKAQIIIEAGGLLSIAAGNQVVIKGAPGSSR